jgi:hypothetical protein
VVNQAVGYELLTQVVSLSKGQTRQCKPFSALALDGVRLRRVSNPATA